MIKYYAYYNQGGYKDFYVGNQKELVDFKYFLPLLIVHEHSLIEDSNNEELRKEVEHQRLLPKLITLSDKTAEYNYPIEARTLMSHGGYKVIYKRLTPKYYVLAIRDIAGPKDVYGRQSPFNMMFIGETDDLETLDKLAEHILNNIVDFDFFLCSLFTNDLKENGLRCNVESLRNKIKAIIENGKPLKMEENVVSLVRMLIVSSSYNLGYALKEQNLKKGQIGLCYGIDGSLLFKAQIKQHTEDDSKPNMKNTRDNMQGKDECIDKRQNISLHTMLNTPKLEDIEKLWDYIYKLEKRIETLENKKDERFKT